MIWLSLGAALLALLVGISLAFGAPYVPSRRRDAEMALSQLYPLSKDDVLIDIGSGDGKVLNIAVKSGAGAVGYEVNPLLALVSKARLGGKATINCRDGLRADWPASTTVVYVFGVERIMPALRRKAEAYAKQHGKTLCVISYGFKIPRLKPARAAGPYFLYRF